MSDMKSVHWQRTRAVDIVDQHRSEYVASFEGEHGPLDPRLTARFDELLHPIASDFRGSKIGMYDEIYCNAELPDTAAPAGTWFQTKAFPHPTLARYRITNEGRLIDSVGRDLEVDGYVIFYTDEYSGHLQSIVRGDKEGADWSKYELASFRWFASTAVPESGAERRPHHRRND